MEKVIAMLNLTRRPGESILISIPSSDEQIEVRVMRAGAQVSLGIDAPKDVVILREELLESDLA